MNNFHVVVIHFPIAFLTLYSVLEIISIKRLQNKPYWFYIKAVLVILGAVAAVVARQTGELLIAASKGPLPRVLELHKLFGTITAALFLVIAFVYVVEWVKKCGSCAWLEHKSSAWLWHIFLKIQGALYRRPVLVLSALAGLATITITGALGGSMVYGPETDPMGKFIYHLFIK